MDTNKSANSVNQKPTGMDQETFKMPMAKVRLSDLKSTRDAQERRQRLLMEQSTVQRESQLLDKMLKERTSYESLKSHGFTGDYQTYVDFIEYRNLVYGPSNAAKSEADRRLSSPLQPNNRHINSELDNLSSRRYSMGSFKDAELRFSRSTPVKSQQLVTPRPLNIPTYQRSSPITDSQLFTPVLSRTSSGRFDRASPMSISSDSSRLSVRTVYPPPASQSLSREQEWLRQLRERIRNAAKPSASVADKVGLAMKVETPTFDRLQQDLQDLLAGKPRKRWDKKDNFPPLSSEIMAIVKKCMKKTDGLIVSKFNIDIGPQDIRRLVNGCWLNDELINFYCNLIAERAESNPDKYPKVHVFNTFFYSTLKESGYGRVRRWTRKFDIFEKELVLFPVHLGNHWCCGVIDMKNKRIEYYDSLHGLDYKFFAVVRRYLEEEHQDKKSSAIDLSDWEDIVPKNIPAQENGYDCGVFACTYADYRSRLEPFDFTQQHMVYLRNRMIYEISNSRLLIF